MNFMNNSNNRFNIPKFLIALSVLLIVSAEPSFAQNFSGVNTFMTTLVNALTGPIGVTISAIAVMAVGFSFLTGRMDWTFAVSIILGIAIVFGAATFVGGLKATGTITSSTTTGG